MKNIINKNISLPFEISKEKTTFHPAILGMWASILIVSRLIPGMPVLGTGSTFTVSVTLFPLSGIFFGPFHGALCAAVGGFLGQILVPGSAWLGIFTFLIGTFTALVAGLISRGYWYIGLLSLVLGTFLWFTTETGQSAPMFAIAFYGLGGLASIVGGINYKKLYQKNIKCKMLAVFIASFVGMIASASIANYLSIIFIGTPPDVWKVLTFLSPIERMFFSSVSAIIGVPVLAALNLSRKNN